MRISGYGSGSGHNRRSPAERRRAFRAAHKVGDVIRARVLRREDEHLHWIKVHGDELLAALLAPAAPGDMRTFLVEALTPDIVLKDITGHGGDGTSLAGAVQAFWQGRLAFESAAAALFGGEPGDAGSGRAYFFEELAANRDALRSYMELNGLCRAMDAALPRGAGFAWMPWLVPGARGQELVWAKRDGGSGTFTEAVYEVALKKAGRCQVRLLIKGSRTGFRLLLENPVSRTVMENLVAHIPGTGQSLDCLGTAKLSRTDPGPLNMLLAPASDDTSIIYSQLI